MTSTEAHEDPNSPDPAAASDSSNPAARQGSPWMVAPHQTAVAAGAVEDAVRRALAEDRAEDDITTRWAVPDGTRAQARVVARQDGVIAGTAITAEVYRQLGGDVVTEHVQDGDRVRAEQDLLTLAGPAREIITGERTALNFLQRMSGIATAAAAFAQAVAGLPVRILDTRKTAPGLRALDKAAVAAGGVSNHRLDLAAMVLLKENHIAAAGGVSAAIAAVRAHNTQGIAVEVEVESTAQAIEALHAEVEWIMLDNMSIEEMRYIVALRGTEGPRLEASGNITLSTVRSVAQTGVDAISVGGITHSAPAFDLSLLLTPTTLAGESPRPMDARRRGSDEPPGSVRCVVTRWEWSPHRRRPDPGHGRCDGTPTG